MSAEKVKNKDSVYLAWGLSSGCKTFYLNPSSLYRSFTIALILISSLYQPVLAQLAGIKNVPGDYATLTAAISALNAQGVGAGGVVINLMAGNPQTSPTSGYIIGGTGSLVLTTASMSNQVILQGNGNTITAPTTLTSGALNDAIFKIIGADWITLDGFVLMENAANTTTTAGSNNMIEWGIALLYVSTTNGAQHVTLKNNTIDLNRTYQNTFGIYSNSTHSPAAPLISATATTTDGGNSGLKIYTNTITDVNQGILVVGPLDAADFNVNIDIGGTSGATANTLTNYGTTGTFSAYANVSGTVFGILVRNSTTINVSYNSITSSNGGTIADTLRAIYIPAFSLKATGTFTTTINNNNISVITGVAAAPLQGIAIEDSTGTTTSTLNINHNNFNNCGYNVGSPTGAATFILAVMSPSVSNLVTTISNNTFTNLTISTSGNVSLIAHNFTVPAGGSQTINSNAIVTAFNKTGAGGTVFCLSSTGGTIAPDAVISQTNNNFSNITVTGATAIRGIENLDGLTTTATTKTITGNIFNNWTGGTAPIIVMTIAYLGGQTTVSNNTISNISSQDSIRGLSFNPIGVTANPLTIDNNTISNFTSTGIGGNLIGIRCSNASPVINISNNNIHSFSSTGASSKLLGIYITVAASTNVFQNSIHTFSASGATSPIVNGIFVFGGATISMYKNKIYGLQKSGAVTGSSPPVNGISIHGGSSVTTHNNLIGNLTAPAANLADAVRGISVTSTLASSTQNVYFNTIYINASSTGTNFGTSGIFHAASATATTATLNLRNNIIVNLSTANGTGKITTYRRSGTNLTNYGAASNNNLFYGGVPGASNLIFFDGTNSDQTLTAYKSRVTPRDAASVTENPPFQSTTGSSPDFLHINPSIGTQVESGAAPIGGITTDYDGDTRNVTTPDIGADEGTFMIADLIGPSITYALFGNTSCTMDRTLSAAIVDASGVNTTPGTKPRLYFRKTTNANTYIDNTNATNGWKYVEASNSSSPFSFTTNYSLLFGGSGVVVGDSIKYFVVAQDLSPAINIGINSGSFNAPPSSVALVAGNFPITGMVNSYKIIEAGLTGSVTIGAAGTYSSLTETSGLFSEINTKGMSGDLLAEIIDPMLTENGTHLLNSILYNSCSGGPYTLTIKPALGVTITGSSTGAIIRLNGADNVIIDGSIGSGANTVCPATIASRDLTIINTNSGINSAIIWLQSSGPDGATSNSVMNCNLTGNSSTTTLFGIGSGSSTISTTSVGNGNNNNVFINNHITKVQNGIYSQGSSATNKNTGTIIQQNLINGNSPNNVGICGIRVGFESGIQISGNKIEHLSGVSTTIGISLGLLPSNTYNSFTGNEVAGAMVSKNIIHDIVCESDGTALGISFSAVTTAGSAANTMANNMISAVRSVGATPNNFTAGILIGGGSQGSTIALFNSVSMTGQCSNSSAGFGIAIGGSNPVVDIRNNIFVNELNSDSEELYAIGLAYNTYSNLTSNYNDFFTSADPLAIIGGFGNIPAGVQSNLLAWQTTTGTDGASLNMDPGFVSPGDLHIDSGNPVNLPLDEGGEATSITDDIDCETRNADIGADEFLLIVCINVAGGTATITGPSSFCGEGTPDINASGYSSGIGSAYQWMSYVSGGDPPGAGMPVSGQTNPATLTTGILDETSFFRLRVICSTGPDTTYSNLVTITIYPEPLAIISGPSVKCENDPAVSFTETGGTASSWLWSTSETTSSILVDPAVSTNYTVTVTSVDGCTASASIMLNVLPTPSTPIVTPDIPQNICLGANQPLTAMSTAEVIPIVTEDFNNTTPGNNTSGNLPAGWSGSSLTQGVRIWGVVASAQEDNTLGDGNFLYCDSDQYSAYQTRAQVTTPEFDASGFTSVNIRFRHYYNDLLSGVATDSARVYISNDGGTNFIQIQEYDSEQGNAFSGSGAVIAMIPAGIPLTENMKVRLIYNSDADGNDWYWAVDDFVIEGVPDPLYYWTASPLAGAGLPANAGTPSVSNASILTLPTLPGVYTYTVISTAAGCASLPSSSAMVTVHPTIVTNSSDNEPGSLRDIISCSPDGSIITFDAGLTGQTIILTAGEIMINKNITLSGLGTLSLTISGNNASRIFHLHTGFNLAIENMALKNAAASVNGGALFVEGHLILENVLMENNHENGSPKALTMAPSGLLEIAGNVEVRN